MATYSRKLTLHATVTAGATDTITFTGPDSSPSGGLPAPPYATPGATTGAGAVRGGRVYNAGAGDLWWSYGRTAAADPATTSNEGVRRLPSKATDQFDDVWDQVVVRVSAVDDCEYSVEVNP
jgi:hypothetical protein